MVGGCVYSPLCLKDSLCPYSVHSQRQRQNLSKRQAVMAATQLRTCSHFPSDHNIILSGLNFWSLCVPLNCQLLFTTTAWHRLHRLQWWLLYQEPKWLKHFQCFYVLDCKLRAEWAKHLWWGTGTVLIKILLDVRLVHANHRSIKQLRHRQSWSQAAEPQRVSQFALWGSRLRKPTWEAAASLWAVVRAGGAEILWLVVWYSIRQSFGQSVVRNEKEGYSGGWRAKITVASGVWQLAQAHASMQLEHLASRTYSGFRHSTRSTCSTFHSLSGLYAKGNKLAGLIWFVHVKSTPLSHDSF